LPYAIIFEDDVILSDNFTNILNNYITQLPENYDMLFIGDGANLHIEKHKLKEEISLVLSKSKNTKKTKEISKIQTQNNNSNIQNQINITINFGEEDMKKLTESEILTSLKSLSNCFQNFVKIIH
jgi:GR25 family glycosyltransferase involved in LPS biosynthesis